MEVTSPLPSGILLGLTMLSSLRMVSGLSGKNSQRDFWRDNWLGMPILDFLRILDFLAMHLQAKVSDFIRDGRWILVDRFRARFRISAFGLVGLRFLRLPTEDRLCRSGFQLASRCSVYGASSESVDQLFLKCPLTTTLWEAVFSTFRGVPPLTLGVLFSVWHSVYDANRLGISCMRNCVDDLLILHRFGLSGQPGKALVSRSVVWSPPAPGWIKVNTDGASLGSPGVEGCGGVFRTCRSFVKACFAVPIGQVFAFEAKLLAASLAINYAWNLGWHRIWLESDSSYVVQLLSIRSD
ncbi:hypothetical protein Dsin_029103 [Dipteronia sinensis]|uniref:RNase H type-1 domain-containing protein n=1 Tax=Dipteronia sinensis TaxID=43782 RepID=A0AAD9ZS15_9ROSI|nr:hypothetical protein Dsin_029103 [Dipteronia sinensis]